VVVRVVVGVALGAIVAGTVGLGSVVAVVDIAE
jgi:hypothetical protein